MATGSVGIECCKSVKLLGVSRKIAPQGWDRYAVEFRNLAEMRHSDTSMTKNSIWNCFLSEKIVSSFIIFGGMLSSILNDAPDAPCRKTALVGAFAADRHFPRRLTIMIQNDLNAATSIQNCQCDNFLPHPAPLLDYASLEEKLPFTIKLVRNQEDLRKAVLIRHAAYGRHVPQFAETLRLPERTDSEDGVVVLLAEAKLNGAPVGTMRIQTNRFGPLSVEQSLRLPDWLQGCSTAEATRLGVTEDRIGRLVKTALFKAYFQYCLHAGVEWMVITARSPLDRQYERLMFEDIYPGMGYVPMPHVANMPHRVMAFNVPDARSKWRKANHPLFDYMFRTTHPDIDVAPTSLPARLPAGARLGQRAIREEMIA